MPEIGCERKTTSKTLDQGSTRFVYDFEEKKHDLGPQTPERLAREQATTICDYCLIEFSITAEGGPPFGAINEVNRQTLLSLQTPGFCLKWQEKVTRERAQGFTISDIPPESWFRR